MSELTEIKTECEHYFEDAARLSQGECKQWHDNGQLSVHCFYVDSQVHGECKRWHASGQMRMHCFYVDGESQGECKQWHDSGELWHHSFCENRNNITADIKALVVDINNISSEERMLIKLRFGIDCLPELV